MGFRKHGDGRVLSEDGGKVASEQQGLTPEVIEEIEREGEEHQGD